MKKELVILLSLIIFAFIFCGAASAATVKTNQISNAKINNVGTVLKPDLTPTIIEENNGGNSSGSYYILLGVKNVGKKSSPKFTSNLYMDGKFVGSINYAALAPGKSVYINEKLKKGTKAGKHLFKNVVDPGNKISEMSEKNNIQTEDVILYPLVIYLNVLKCKVTPDTETAVREHYADLLVYKLKNVPVTINFTIKNISKVSIKELIDDVAIGAEDINTGTNLPINFMQSYANKPIKPGQTVQFSIKTKITWDDETLRYFDVSIGAAGLDNYGVVGFSKQYPLAKFTKVFRAT